MFISFYLRFRLTRNKPISKPQLIEPPPPPLLPVLVFVGLVVASLTSGAEVSSCVVGASSVSDETVVLIVRERTYVLLLVFISVTVDGLTMLTECVMSTDVFVLVVLMDRVFEGVDVFNMH